MRCRLSILGLFALSLIITPSWAENWKYLGQQGGGSMWLNLDSAHQEGAQVVYWVKRVYAKPQTLSPQKATYLQQHVEHLLDCKHRTVSFLATQFYDSTGKRISSAPMAATKPKPINAEGLIHQEASLLCQ